MVLLKTLTDVSQIMALAHQMYPRRTQFFLEAFVRATTRHHGYMVIDMKQLFFGIWIRGDPMHIPWKITEGRQSSLPLGVYVEGIARTFNWVKCLGGIIHLQPRAGCQISTLIFGFEGTLYISHDKLPKDGKVLYHLGFRSKVLPGSLSDLNA
jgi:hypothetical protein